MQLCGAKPSVNISLVPGLQQGSLGHLLQSPLNSTCLPLQFSGIYDLLLDEIYFHLRLEERIVCSLVNI